MNIKEIISKFVDPERVTLQLRRELEDAIARTGLPKSPELMQAMYGDERGDLEIEQLRADLAKTKSEADGIAASAARDKAETQQTIGLSRGRVRH